LIGGIYFHLSKHPSKDALEKVIGLAKVSDNAKLFVLHVVPQLPIPPMFDRSISTPSGEPVTMAKYFKEIYDELKIKAKEKLAHVEDKCENDGINTEIRISSCHGCKIKGFYYW